MEYKCDVLYYSFQKLHQTYLLNKTSCLFRSTNSHEPCKFPLREKLAILKVFFQGVAIFFALLIMIAWNFCEVHSFWTYAFFLASFSVAHKPGRHVAQCTATIPKTVPSGRHAFCTLKPMRKANRAFTTLYLSKECTKHLYNIVHFFCHNLLVKEAQQYPWYKLTFFRSRVLLNARDYIP